MDFTDGILLQVERKEKGKEWVVVNQDLVIDCRYSVPCMEGKTYDFRVAAVNDGGEGEHCRPITGHLCRVPIDPASKLPWISLQSFHRPASKLLP